MISSLPRTQVPTKKPSGAARLPRRVFSVSPVAATGSGRKKSQTFPPPPDAGSGIPPSHRVPGRAEGACCRWSKCRRWIPTCFLRSGPGVWLAKYRSKGIASAAANVRRSWENDPASGPSISSVGLRASPARRSRSLSRSRPTEPLVCPPERPPAPPVPPDQTAAPAPGDEPTNLSLSIWPGQPAAASPPDGHRPRGSENSPQCGSLWPG